MTVLSLSRRAAPGNSLLTTGLSASVLALLPLGSAQAQATFFADRPTFAAAATGTTTLGFEGLALNNSNTIYPSPPGLTLSGVTFSIDPAVSSGRLQVNGINSYYLGTSVLTSQSSFSASDEMLVTFAAPVTAIALDFGDNVQTRTFSFTLSDGETFTRPAGTGFSLNFVGLTTTTGITSLDIRTPSAAGGRNALNIDNFTFGQAAPPSVPEASTTVSLSLLLALGMGGVVIAARRKKAVA